MAQAGDVVGYVIVVVLVAWMGWEFLRTLLL